MKPTFANHFGCWIVSLSLFFPCLCFATFTSGHTYVSARDTQVQGPIQSYGCFVATGLARLSQMKAEEKKGEMCVYNVSLSIQPRKTEGRDIYADVGI